MFLASVKKGLSAISSSHDRLAKLLLVFILPVFLYLSLLPVVPSLQSFALERSHLRTRPFALWLLIQHIPAMYSFENRFEFSTLSSANSVGDLEEVKHFKDFLRDFCNSLDGRRLSGFRKHFPGAFFNSIVYRTPLLLSGSKDFQIRLKSKYRSASIESIVRLKIDWSDTSCPPRRTRSTIIREILE